MKTHIRKWWLAYFGAGVGLLCLAVLYRVGVDAAPYFDALGKRMIDGTATAADLLVIAIFGAMFIRVFWSK